MSLVAVFTPTTPARPNLCDYGSSFFYFVPGAAGNPFAAVWQANLVTAAVLLVAGALVLGLSRVGQWRGVVRRMGWVYIGVAVISALLAVITLALTRPLACYGAPGAGSPSSAELHDYQVYQSVQLLGGLMVYLTLLLLGIFGIMLITVGARVVWRHIR